MGPRGKKPLLDQQVKDQATLKVLKSEDPDVEEILGSASHVTLYGFDLNEQAWVRAPSPLSRSPGGRYACPFLRSSTSPRSRSNPVRLQLGIRRAARTSKVPSSW